MLRLIKSTTFLSIFLLPLYINGQDLILDNGSTPAMNGMHVYGVISLTNNSAIMVSGGYNTLTLVCDSIFIESGSGIYANGSSLNDNFQGEDWASDVGGGGGGGHAGTGGTGGGSNPAQGGAANGDIWGESGSASTGSIGGAGGNDIGGYSLGGTGGGLIRIIATSGMISGTIQANGLDGRDAYTSGGNLGYDYGGGGGGAGGHIRLDINRLTLSNGATITANGGNGGIPSEGSFGDPHTQVAVAVAAAVT